MAEPDADVAALDAANLAALRRARGLEEPEKIATASGLGLSLLGGLPPEMQKAGAGVLAAMFGDDETDVKPEPDPTFHHDNGYILPNGDFYGCLFHGHAALADRILRLVLNVKEGDVVDPETEADAYGWIRLSTGPMMGFNALRSPDARGKPTSRALDTLALFCDRWEKPFPARMMDY